MSPEIRSRFLVSMACLAISLAGAATLARAQLEYRLGEVLVAFEEDVPVSLCEASIAAVGSRVIRHYEHVGVFLVSTAPGMTELETAALLEADPNVLGASPNYIREHQAHLTTPNDPQFSRQWGLDNTGRNLVGLAGILGNAVGIIDADIDAPQGWEHTTNCSNEVVAILDSGVDLAHPDFAGNVFVNPGDPTVNAMDEDGNGIVDDVNGANFAAYETHAENVAANGQFDGGEAIYIDNDASLTVSAGDTDVNTAMLAAGTPLIDFVFTNAVPRYEMHTENIAANGVFDAGESIYDDIGPNANQVDAVDTLLQGAAMMGAALIRFANRGPNNSTTDVQGHGTSVAGVVGARGNNATNIAGVCWSVQLLTVKVARPIGPTGSSIVSDEIAGINYIVGLKTRAMNPVNVRIINFSAGAVSAPIAPELAAINAAAAAGILFVTAAGNVPVINVDGIGGGMGMFPCNYVPAPVDNVVCVTGSDNRDNRVFNFGVVSVDLAAPGVDIVTLRRTVAGGGAVPVSGTSFSAPMVAGIAAHFWSLPGFTTHTVAQLKARLLSGTNGPVGVAHPHGVDPRSGIAGSVLSGLANDGRARMTMGDDFGDAPGGLYRTRLAMDGARHEDIGEEWLGRPPSRSDVSPEFDAVDAATYPADPDGFSNLARRDAHDDGIGMVGPFFFSPPVGPPNQATVEVYIDTENNTVADAEGGRYGGGHIGSDGVHGAGDDKFVWVNGFFDWNVDEDWEDANEHVFMLRADPSTWATSNGRYTVTFNVPPPPALIFGGNRHARFRLDYGENLGQALAAPPHAVGPSPGGLVKFWDDGGGLPFAQGANAANRYESIVVGAPPALDLTRGLAQFGEVEDYIVPPLVPAASRGAQLLVGLLLLAAGLLVLRQRRRAAVSAAAR